MDNELSPTKMRSVRYFLRSLDRVKYEKGDWGEREQIFGLT